MNTDTPLLPPIEIPTDALSAEALSGIVDDFILREGTDYGSQEVTYDSKVRRVLQQLEKGDVKIAFDPNSETVTLLSHNEWLRLTGISQPLKNSRTMTP